MPSYQFTGVTGRSYTQYIDLSTGHMLQTEPGGSYDMAPAPGNDTAAVPPGDGLWGPQRKANPKAPAPAEDADGQPPSATPDTTTPAASAAAKEG